MASFAYQWLRNGVPIAGATAQTYTPVEADQLTTLTCQVSTRNAGGVTKAVSNPVTVKSAVGPQSRQRGSGGP
jgi:hypothetical protein